RYTSDGTFLSVTASPHFRNAHPTNTALLGPDTLLIADPTSPTPGAVGQRHLRGRDGSALSAFGRLTAPPPGNNNYARNISQLGDSFWAGPLHGTPEYLLEEWSLAGTLKRRIRREVSWFAEAAGSMVPGGFPVVI